MKTAIKIIVAIIVFLCSAVGIFSLIRQCIKVRNFLPDVNYENMM